MSIYKADPTELKKLVLSGFDFENDLNGPLTVEKTVIKYKQFVRTVERKKGDTTYWSYSKPLGYVVVDNNGKRICLERQEAVYACTILSSTNTKVYKKEVMQKTKNQEGNSESKKNPIYYMKGTGGLSLQRENFLINLQYLIDRTIPISPNFEKALNLKTTKNKKSQAKHTKEEIVNEIKKRRIQQKSETSV